jgi:microcystin-dependent protein
MAPSMVPVGVCLPFAGPEIPAGWLLCDGSAVSRKTYAALFDVIDTTWGVGDGKATFNVPDLRRRTLIGSGGLPKAGPGLDVGNVGGDELLQTHNHSMDHTHPAVSCSNYIHSHTLRGGTGGTPGPAFPQVTMANGGFGGADAAPVVEDKHGHDITVSPFAGNTASQGAGSAQNMPPSAVVHYMIKT